MDKKFIHNNCTFTQTYNFDKNMSNFKMILAQQYSYHEWNCMEICPTSNVHALSQVGEHDILQKEKSN